MRVVLVGDPSVAADLRDRGVEVVYLAGADPLGLVRTAVQEDADAIAAPGALPAITALLADNGAVDIAVVGVDSIVSWVVDTAGE
ncbi:hypothetical protein [Actinokineospora globicatena]|uniref:Uncharacterized protein n=1 Tax=Actinokineospora globicatena TaxID=103729 RepID=A0A9W6QPZ8_9PSEU|nr:hypothetical protein [Actinokineospora globicatena]MCP2301962.1 hypothetical protein [Actinokineospora globicatena]GLW76378.1 hypothetical protein Aglo01_08600 [Actinokineospora globicatena]GLW83213.1 hypothetical protein Aglo02_08530 [Actinokineospora globicatena]GLW94816.1 hypothetical protein Aglo03_56320 [Actinokineospora globicatena]